MDRQRMKHEQSGTESLSQQHPSLSLITAKPYGIMGIINVTPDSFYDGGRYKQTDQAVAQGKSLIEKGADILDIGGESSRPGALAVSLDEERQRIIPVIEQLRKYTDIPISVDTTKATLAKDALLAGATWINDISAGRFDQDMTSIVAEMKCPIVLMHSRQSPATMQQDPFYKDVTKEVVDELNACVAHFIDQGVSAENIILDPGIGFAKRFEDNLKILNELPRLVECGFPVLIGTSRKSFIGKILNKEVDDRLYGTLGSIAAAYQKGARLFRVHDVEETKHFLQVLTAITNYS